MLHLGKNKKGKGLSLSCQPTSCYKNGWVKWKIGWLMQHRLAKLLVTGLYLSEYHVEGDTPWKLNIAPENGWLEDEFPFGKAYFQGLC